MKDKIKDKLQYASAALGETIDQVKNNETVEEMAQSAKVGAEKAWKWAKMGAEVVSKGATAGANAVKSTVNEYKQEYESAEKTPKLDEQLRSAVTEYNAVYAEFENNGASILRQRERSVDLLNNVETLINSIANHPKTFDSDFVEIQHQKKIFKDVCDFAKQELDAAKASAVEAGAGIAGGMAVASLVPSAAMWIATTFGTASTGAAISTLSGAAATNAALAWLGGGALAAGGGGVGAGTALLALAGPVAWTIGGATLLASITLFATSKIKLEKEKKTEIEAVLKNVEAVKEMNAKLQSILEKTDALRSALSNLYGNCLSCYGKDFMTLSEEKQFQLGTLVNNAKSLAATLDETVEG